MAHTREHYRYRSSRAAVVDLLGALACALFFAPLFVTIYLLVKTDGGPAIVAFERAKSDGTTFTAWRFRTTNPKPLAGAEPTSFTRLGALLHRYRLDQLPEFANVIRGEMTLTEMMQ